MRNLFVLALSLSPAATLQAQVEWEPAQKLSDTPNLSYLSYNNTQSLAAWGASVHVVWGEAYGAFEIRYARSLDEGSTWQPDILLSHAPGAADYPALAAWGAFVHVVWQNAWNEIYYSRSGDAGETWFQEQRLTTDPDSSLYPCIAASDSILHVAWQDLRDGNMEVYYKRSTDNGQTWGEDVNLSNTVGRSVFPAVRSQGSDVYLVWADAGEIYFKHSPDNGQTWQDNVRLTDDPADSEHPALAVDGSRLHVAWTDDRNAQWTNHEIYYKNSTDGGLTWSEDRRLTDAPEHSRTPVMAASDSAVYLSWYDFRDGNFEVYFKYSSDLGQTWSADTNLSANASTSYSPFLALSDSILHLVMQDNQSGNHEIYYKRGKIPVEPEPGVCEDAADERAELKILRATPAGAVISYAVPRSASVRLSVFDVTGRTVRTLVCERSPQGTHTVFWDANDSRGTPVPAGVYACVMEAEDAVVARKFTLTR